MSIPRDALLQRVERELALCVGDACLLPPGMNLSDVASSSKKSFFLLQRWSQKWNAFIDVASVEDVKDADKITVVPAFAPACEKCCDGDSLLVPLIHPGSDTSMFTKLARILSHGYMQCGFLPLKIAFPVLAAMLLGVEIAIPNKFLISTIIDSLNSYEQDLLKQGLSSTEFSCDLQGKLVAIVSRFGARELPTPNNLKDSILQLAKYQFQTKPLPVIIAINAGIPDFERRFWDSKTLADIYLLYFSMVATPAKVIDMIQEPDLMNAIEQRIFTYLCQMVGDMKTKDLSSFVWFVTGSSVCLGKKIMVSFSSLTGLGRRPVAHTCDCLLEIPCSYISYMEFTAEFKAILCNPEHAWCMTLY